MICHREGSGIELHVGMPCRKSPFLNNQKISPSVACCTSGVRKLGFFFDPSALAPWHLAQWSANILDPAAIASLSPAYGLVFVRSASGTCCIQPAYLEAPQVTVQSMSHMQQSFLQFIASSRENARIAAGLRRRT